MCSPGPGLSTYYEMMRAAHDAAFFDAEGPVIDGECVEVEDGRQLELTEWAKRVERGEIVSD